MQTSLTSEAFCTSFSAVETLCFQYGCLEELRVFIVSSTSRVILTGNTLGVDDGNSVDEIRISCRTQGDVG